MTPVQGYAAGEHIYAGLSAESQLFKAVHPAPILFLIFFITLENLGNLIHLMFIKWDQLIKICSEKPRLLMVEKIPEVT